MSAGPLFVARITLALFATFFLFAGGCTKISERTHARYELGTPFKYRPAEPGGTYEVKWSATPDGPRYTLEGTQRTVGQGELLGFVLDESGQLLAVAGDSRFPISPPEEARHFVWSTEIVGDSQFIKNLKGK